MIINTVVKGVGGGGNQVSAYALGKAAEALAGDKVILNAAANMFPSEPEIDFTGAEASTSSWQQAAYCDRELVTLGRSTSYTNTFKREASGKYVYSVFYGNSGITGYGYGMFGTAVDFSYSDIHINFSSTGYRIGYQAALSFSSDYKYALATSNDGSSIIYVFRRLAESFSFVNTATTTTYSKNALGIVKVENTYYAIKPTSKTEAAVYSITDSNDLSLVSSSIPITESLPSSYMGFWRIFDNESKAVIYVPPTGYNGDGYSVTEAIFVVDINYTDGVPSSIQVNTGLTASLRSAGSFITNRIKISIVDDRDIYIWGTGGCAAVRYDNSVSSFKIIPVPFPDIPYVDAMFVHPKDKIAIIQTGPVTAYIRELDAPVDQLYVATKPADGSDLSFPTVSLTGIVKENNSGILTVETVEDPNNPPPEHPDTYGLGYTVDSGSIHGVWKRPNLTSSTSYGVCTDGYEYSGEEAWRALDGVDSTRFVPALSGTWWKWELPVTLKSVANESKITWVHRSNTETMGDYPMQFFTDETMTTPLTDTFIDPTSAYGTVVLLTTYSGDLNTIYLNIPAHDGYGGASEIKFDGFLTPDLDPGSIAINWGWYKFSGIYYKYSGGTATLDNVQGDKATTMNLYLASDAEGTVTPVITTSEPLGYVSSHLLGKVYLSDTLDYFVDAPI